MKWLITLAVSIGSFNGAVAQKVVKNEIDAFSKEKRVETNYVKIGSGFTWILQANCRSVADKYFFNLNGKEWGVGTIGENDQLLFLLQNDSTIAITPTGIQSYEIAQGGNYYTHQYYLTKSDIETLSTVKVKKMRKYYSSKYDDVDIKDKNSDNLMHLFAVFSDGIK